MPEVSAVRVSPTLAVPLMAGSPVAGVFAACCCESGPLTVISSSFGQHPAVVGADGAVGLAVRGGGQPDGHVARWSPVLTVICHRMFLPFSSRRSPVHLTARHREGVVLQRLVAEVFLGVLAEAQLEGEIRPVRRGTPARRGWWPSAASPAPPAPLPPHAPPRTPASPPRRG